MKDIEKFVESMKRGEEKFILTDEGNINKFLGIKINQLDENRFKVSQPFLVDRILSFLKIDRNAFGTSANPKSTPVGKPLLNKDLSGKPRKESWNYRTAVGMLGYLQGNSRPKKSVAVHQTVHFSNKPMLSHERSINCLG